MHACNIMHADASIQDGMEVGSRKALDDLKVRITNPVSVTARTLTAIEVELQFGYI